MASRSRHRNRKSLRNKSKTKKIESKLKSVTKYLILHQWDLHKIMQMSMTYREFMESVCRIKVRLLFWVKYKYWTPIIHRKRSRLYLRGHQNHHDPKQLTIGKSYKKRTKSWAQKSKLKTHKTFNYQMIQTMMNFKLLIRKREKKGKRKEEMIGFLAHVIIVSKCLNRPRTLVRYAKAQMWKEQKVRVPNG